MSSDSNLATSASATSRPDIRPSLVNGNASCSSLSSALSPDSVWESDAVSEGQTLRNEDNAFLPLSSGQISLLREFCQSHKALCQAAKKTLKQHVWRLRRTRFAPRTCLTAAFGGGCAPGGSRPILYLRGSAA